MISLPEIERTISSFGNTPILMGVALTASLYFFICRDNREAIAILCSLAFAAISIVLLKLGFLSCGNNFFGVKSPSGHSALAVAVFGTYPLLIAPRVGPRMRTIIYVFFYTLALAIVYTRVSLHLHSTSEAIIGLIIGIASILLVRFFVIQGKLIGGKINPSFNVYFLLALTVGIIALMYGINLPVEQMIQSSARHIRSAGFCPF